MRSNKKKPRFSRQWHVNNKRLTEPLMHCRCTSDLKTNIDVLGYWFIKIWPTTVWICDVRQMLMLGVFHAISTTSWQGETNSPSCYILEVTWEIWVNQGKTNTPQKNVCKNISFFHKSKLLCLTPFCWGSSPRIAKRYVHHLNTTFYMSIGFHRLLLNILPFQQSHSSHTLCFLLFAFFPISQLPLFLSYLAWRSWVQLISPLSQSIINNLNNLHSCKKTFWKERQRTVLLT